MEWHCYTTGAAGSETSNISLVVRILKRERRRRTAKPSVGFAVDVYNGGVVELGEMVAQP